MANITFLSAILFALTLFSNVHCWNDHGHYLVAAIAQSELSPEILKIVGSYLSESSDIFKDEGDFIMAASWADRVKWTEHMGLFKTMHYITHPVLLDGYTPAEAIPEQNVNVVFALKEAWTTLTAAEADDWTKAIGFRLAIHMTGDVHQPLHCSSSFDTDHTAPGGDIGGNARKCCPDQTNYHNLHDLWDTSCTQYPDMDFPLTDTDMAQIAKEAAALKKEFPRSKFDGEGKLGTVTRSSFMTWSWESKDAAVAVAYKQLDEFTGHQATTNAPESYLANAKPVARERLALAGYRLVDVLETLYQKQQWPMSEHVFEEHSDDKNNGSSKGVWIFLIVSLIVNAILLFACFMNRRRPFDDDSEIRALVSGDPLANYVPSP
eukprot:TRINITY_DN2163_c0_g1_i2.p1 TRINITY_DN2163_c0_g1~~TRINITY_DN2163_c0_g1_i2.p1  ORF type:complete len:378 (+),score=136.72 TRINITY_DN2163_c0_g1_i2:95-1228(+)